MSESTTGLITKENITLAIAIWGAVLSTYKIISDYFKNMRSMKIKVSHGIAGIMGSALRTLSIEAINTGYRDITLSSGGLLLPNKLKLITFDTMMGSVQFPHTLKEGNSCSILLEYSKLVQNLKDNGFSGKVTVKGYYRSAISKVFESKPFNLILTGADGKPTVKKSTRDEG